MNYLDLFSGIGGFRLGAEMASLSFDAEYHSEIDEYAIEVYRKHYKQSICLGDITSVSGKALRTSHPEQKWLLTGGFPCQDLSTAGHRKGLSGAKSKLFFEMWRVVHELRPEVVVAENVRQLATRGLDEVLRSFAKIGYDAEWQVISAGAFGAPHHRHRLWIVAYPSEAPNSGEAVLGRQRVFEFAPEAGDMVYDNEFNRTFTRVDQWSDWAAEISKRAMQDRTVVRRVDDGLPDGVDPYRLTDWGTTWRQVDERGKCLGNAIVPQIAAWIFRTLERKGYLR